MQSLIGSRINFHYSSASRYFIIGWRSPDEKINASLIRALAQLTDSGNMAQVKVKRGCEKIIVGLCMRTDGLHTTLDNVLVTNGLQQGLDIISRLTLMERFKLFTEQPTYLAACQCVKVTRCQYSRMPSDSGGMSVFSITECQIENTEPESGVVFD